MHVVAAPPALPFARSGAARLGALSLLLFAAACASTPPVAPPTRPAPGPGPITPPASVEGLSLTALPGWAEEDHLAAFNAYVAGCVRARGGAAEAVCAAAPRARARTGPTAASAPPAATDINRRRRSIMSFLPKAMGRDASEAMAARKA